MEIFVAHRNEQLGPFSVAELQAKISEGTVRSTDYAWFVGLDDWQPVSTILERVAAGSGVIKPPPFPSRRRTNYIARHWRGDLPLGVAYWVSGCLVTLVITFATHGLFAAESVSDLRLTSVLILSMFAAGIIISIWQLVGIWRSASRHISRGGRRVWAGIAKFVVVIGVIRMAFLFWNSYIPQSNEFIAILKGDAKFPAYRIRVLPGGTELEFVGGLRAGCAREFDRVLAANPKVEALDIESRGGRIFEARKITQRIRERGLSTYSTKYCLSAAALVLISGKDRRIAKGTRVGFHRGSLPGATLYQKRVIENLDRKVMRDAGVSEQFINRVLATPADKIWYPEPNEMISAGAITGVF
jgi:GYF domain 2